MNDIVSVVLLLVSMIIVVGFLSNYQFLRTGFPGILFLILLGFLVGPVFNFIKTEDIAGYAPYLSDLATNLILFEAGLAMNLKKTFKETPRALLMTVLHLVFCTVAVALFLMFIGVELPYGALFGILISGNSAAALVYILRSIKVRDEVVTAVTLESTLNNIIQVISFLALIEIITTGYIDLSIVFQGLAARFCVGAVIGSIFGIFWLNILSKIKHENYASMLTIAVLFISYYASEYLGGNGALSSLLFGIMLGNERILSRFLGLDIDGLIVDEYMIRFESELAFLIRTFFFVYIGLTINITDPLWIWYGVIISIILLVMRVFSTYITTFRSPLKSERNLISIVLSRGLNEAVLIVTFINYGLPYSLMFQNIAFIIIIITNVFCTIGVYFFNNDKQKLEKQSASAKKTQKRDTPHKNRLSRVRSSRHNKIDSSKMKSDMKKNLQKK